MYEMLSYFQMNRLKYTRERRNRQLNSDIFFVSSNSHNPSDNSFNIKVWKET